MALRLAAFVLASALVQMALVAVASALRPAANVYATIVKVSVLTAVLTMLADRLLLGEPLRAGGRVYLALIHLALGGFLFHFMTLPDRSVTLRILVEIWVAPGHVLSMDALRARYGVSTMITSRLEQLSAGHFIHLSADRRIILTAKGRRFGRLVTAGRALFRVTSAN